MNLLWLALLLACGSSAPAPEPPRSTPTAPTSLAEGRAMDVDAFADAQAGPIVDVRSPFAWRAGHIPGSVRISDGDVDPLIEPFSSHPKEVPVYVIDQDGRPDGHAALVVRLLAAAGFDAVRVEGGFDAWRASGRAVVGEAGAGVGEAGAGAEEPGAGAPR